MTCPKSSLDQAPSISLPSTTSRFMSAADSDLTETVHGSPSKTHPRDFCIEVKGNTVELACSVMPRYSSTGSRYISMWAHVFICRSHLQGSILGTCRRRVAEDATLCASCSGPKIDRQRTVDAASSPPRLPYDIYLFFQPARNEVEMETVPCCVCACKLLYLPYSVFQKRMLTF
jgi:hypothetical protein